MPGEAWYATAARRNVTALGPRSSGCICVKPIRAWSSTATYRDAQLTPTTLSRGLPVMRWLVRTMRPSLLVSTCSSSPGAACSHRCTGSAGCSAADSPMRLGLREQILRHLANHLEWRGRTTRSSRSRSAAACANRTAAGPGDKAAARRPGPARRAPDSGRAGRDLAVRRARRLPSSGAAGRARSGLRGVRRAGHRCRRALGVRHADAGPPRAPAPAHPRSGEARGAYDAHLADRPRGADRAARRLQGDPRPAGGARPAHAADGAG